MQIQPRSRIVLTMTSYGAVLGGLAGSLSATTLILTSGVFDFLGGTLAIVLLEIFSIAVFGLLFGGIFGTIAGVSSGMGMGVITSLFFGDIPSPQIFKMVMGGVTGLCTASFFLTGLWHLRIDGIHPASWNATLLMSIVLAMYASQRVASYYLVEWSLRKQKAQA